MMEKEEIKEKLKMIEERMVKGGIWDKDEGIVINR